MIRPYHLPVHLEGIPAELTPARRWVVWQAQRRGETWAKIPYDPRTMRQASVTNPSTWLPFATILPALRSWYSGPGYVLVTGDGIVAVDLDKCRDAETGTVEPWALGIVGRLSSYTEISPSGTGLHIFLRGELPPHGRKKGQVEVYSDRRFIAITGHRLDGTPATLAERQDELLALHREQFGEAPVVGHTGGPVASPPPIDDDEVLFRAEWAGNGVKFMRLWRGQWQDRYSSQSEADAALCAMLAFWTRDPAQLDRLFRRSRLMRPKWNEARGATTYGGQTIALGIAGCGATWNAQARVQQPRGSGVRRAS